MFLKLKKTFTEAPILAYPDFNSLFILQTDLSDTELRAVLAQIHDSEDRVIIYSSRTLNAAERN